MRFYFYNVYHASDLELDQNERRVDFIYCCRDKSKHTVDIMDEVLNHPDNEGKSIIPGTILDSDYRVIKSPQYYSSIEKVEYEGGAKYELNDGTTINLYKWNGELRMGTSNSWDISGLDEYEKGLTYEDYFMEVLEKTDTLDLIQRIDDNKMYTITFTNPYIHLLQNKYIITTFCEELHDIISLPNTTLNKRNFITFNDEVVNVYQSNTHYNISKFLYFNRRRFRSDTYDHGLYKTAIHIACSNNHKLIRKIGNNVINDYMKELYNSVDEYFNECINEDVPFKCPKEIIDFDYAKNVIFNGKYKKLLFKILCHYSEDEE